MGSIFEEKILKSTLYQLQLVLIVRLNVVFLTKHWRSPCV